MVLIYTPINQLYSIYLPRPLCDQQFFDEARSVSVFSFFRPSFFWVLYVCWSVSLPMRLKANEVFLSFYKLPLLLPLLCRSFIIIIILMPSHLAVHFILFWDIRGLFRVKIKPMLASWKIPKWWRLRSLILNGVGFTCNLETPEQILEVVITYYT